MDQVVIASSGSSADARQHEPSGHIPFTKQAKKALELSMRESIQLGHRPGEMFVNDAH
jgi:hypothetical protein